MFGWSVRRTTGVCRWVQLSIGDKSTEIFVRNRANEAARESRFLRKMVAGSSNRRKKQEHPVSVSRTLAEINQIGKGGPRGVPQKSNRTLRRVEVLNSLFMQQITSLMSTGEVAPELMGRGITISQVKISNDFSKVNIYWIASGTEKDLEIEPLLEVAGYALRHSLTRLRVIGMVPPIQFVKDKTLSKVIEVQTLLDKCDLGSDFVPTSPSNYFAQTDQKKSAELESSSSDTESSLEETPVDVVQHEAKSETDLYTLLPCRQDILGVRHDVIAAEIKEAVNKSKRWKSPKPPEEVSTADVQEEKEEEPAPMKSLADVRAEDLANAHRRNDFLKYLRQRSVLKAKELKRNSTAEKEKDFYDNEAFERWKKAVNIDFHDEIDEKEDFEDKEEYHLKR